MPRLPPDWPSKAKLRAEINTWDEPVDYLTYDEAARRPGKRVRFFWITADLHERTLEDGELERRLKSRKCHDGFMIIADKIVELVLEEEDRGIDTRGRIATKQVCWYLHACIEDFGAAMKTKPALREEITLLLAKGIELQYVEDQQIRDPYSVYEDSVRSTCMLEGCDWCKQTSGKVWEDPVKSIGRYCDKEECMRYLSLPGKHEEFCELDLRGRTEISST